MDMAHDSQPAVLLAFLTVYDETGRTVSPDSLAQINLLKSIDHQYRDQGLHTVIIDASNHQEHEKSTNDMGVHFANDWNQHDIPVLLDPPELNITQIYQIQSVPTVILINGDGVVTNRWESAAITQDLAQAIEPLLAIAPVPLPAG